MMQQSEIATVKPQTNSPQRQTGLPGPAVRPIPIESIWVTEFSGKPAYREMRGFADWEKRPQSGA